MNLSLYCPDFCCLPGSSFLWSSTCNEGNINKGFSNSLREKLQFQVLCQYKWNYEADQKHLFSVIWSQCSALSPSVYSWHKPTFKPPLVIRVWHNPWPAGPRPVKVHAGHVDWSVTGPDRPAHPGHASFHIICWERLQCHETHQNCLWVQTLGLGVRL